MSRVKWRILLLKILCWAAAEILLNIAGTDSLMDSQEFLLLLNQAMLICADEYRQSSNKQLNSFVLK
jgi:hypothetical protein